MNRLKELRKKSGLTLDEISKKTGINRGTFSNYENEKTEPSIKTWSELADFFNVSVPYISGISDNDFDRLDPDVQNRLVEDRDKLLSHSFYNGIDQTLSFMEEDIQLDGYGMDSMELIANSVRFSRINGKGKDVDKHRENIRLLGGLIDNLNNYQLRKLEVTEDEIVNNSAKILREIIKNTTNKDTNS